jgi:metal-responsive CopG/Arc/MetJ family transcriptional regulator
MRAVLSVSLPENLASELAEFAHEMGRNKSDIVKESISLFLWEARFNKTRKSLTGKARKQGIVSEDDLFKAVS